MLNKRQEQLLAILTEQKDWITGKQLSHMLKVSDRTIRSDVETLNREISPQPVESNVRRGYRLAKRMGLSQSLPGQEALGQGLYRDPVPPASTIPQTPGARCVYIIQRLLFDTRELNLTDLQNQIYISDYSIQNDLKRIRKMIEPYADLKLIKNKECISLQGGEISKRRFYRDLLVAEVQENFLNLNRMAHLYKNFDLIEVKDIFVQVMEEYDYSINEALFSMLILHAGTSIERMSQCHYVQAEERQQGLEDTIEYQISKTFFERVSDRLHIRVQDGEIAMFALVIMGRRASNYASDHIRFDGRWINTRRMVDGALERLMEVFRVDFRGDEDLKAGLKMHLHGLIDRVNSRMNLEDIFLEEIKGKYPLVFEMGVYLVGYISEQLGVSISDMESGFIALHLGAASERMNSVRKYRAVMILPHNQSFSDMCEKKIQGMFGERMEVVKVLSYFEEEAVGLLDPDLILTTFSIEHKLDVPTVNISLFVDSETEAKILQAINRLDKTRFQLEFASHIGHLMRPEHYYRNLDLDTPEKIIRCLCGGMERAGIVDEHFKNSVMEREKMSPTSFAGALAIPHGFRSFAKNSTIAVAQLKNPVKWGGFEVRLVMLFAINEGDQRMIKIFFDWVSSLIGQPEKLAALSGDCSYETFIEHIMS